MQRFIPSYPIRLSIVCVLWMVGLLYSAEFLLSVCMIALVVGALWDWRASGDRLRAMWKDKAWLALTIPFFLVLFTAPYSTEDPSYLLERLRVKLPFLVLPFVFVGWPPLSQKAYHHLFYVFLCLVSLTSLGVFVNYLLHFDEINALIGQGQSIPTPTNHIRFSLMVAFAVFVGLFLFREGHHVRFGSERWGILGMALFLLGFLHILSVRSGLAVFYLVGVVLLLRYVFLSKKIWMGGLMLIGLVSLPLLAYQMVPSLRQKVSYMLWDLKMHTAGTGEAYSDSERLRSLIAAKEIIEPHPLLGVGAGDLRYQVRAWYQQNHPDLAHDSQKMPHNQYLSVWAGTGLLGLLLFLWGMLYPLQSKGRYKDPLLLSFQLIMLFSFMVENTIENAVGIALYLLFVLLGMKGTGDSLKLPT
jgi:O-antigen ligase